MTKIHELAELYIRLGNRLKVLPDDYIKVFRPEGHSDPITNEDIVMGAAILWSYLRDLFQASDKESFTKGEILLVLELINLDTELWPTRNMLKTIADRLD